MGGEARKKQVPIYFCPCVLLGCSYLFTLRVAEFVCVSVQAVFSEGSLIAEMRAETAGWLLFSLQLVSGSGTPWTVACRAPLSMGFSRQES